MPRVSLGVRVECVSRAHACVGATLSLCVEQGLHGVRVAGSHGGSRDVRRSERLPWCR
jgi:hypothetical protein